jgi:hypothetical protein
MAEPSPNTAQEPIDQASTPITNGTTAATDIEMADSAPEGLPPQDIIPEAAQEVKQEVCSPFSLQLQTNS